MSDITAAVRLQTNEREHTQGHVEGLITGTGPLPEHALTAMEASAGQRGSQIAGQWAPLSPGPGEDGTVTADFDVCGVRLVPGQVPIAGRGPEIQEGWLAYGTLVSVSRRLRLDGEPR
jgi:hypothetical protein